MQNNISFKTEFGLIIVSAIIFIASFLWKDFLSDIEEHLFPKTDGFIGRFFFVVMATICLVLIAVYLKNILKLSYVGDVIKFDDTPIPENFIAHDPNDETRHYYQTLPPK